jgi:hypothetical protein
VSKPDIRVLGVHPVDGVDGCFLIEAVITDATGQPDFGQVTQSRDGHDRSDWQVAYDERLLDLEGGSVQADLFVTRTHDWPREARVAFSFHDLDIARPLSTPFGEASLPLPSDRPERLAMLAYEAP